MGKRNKVESVEGFHISLDSGTIRGKAITVGKTYKATGRLKMCDVGCHASLTLADAAKFRFLKEGRIVSYVRIWGDVRVGTDKVVGRYRKVLAKTYLLAQDVMAKTCGKVHPGHSQKCEDMLIPYEQIKAVEDRLVKQYRQEKREVDAMKDIIALDA